MDDEIGESESGDEQKSESKAQTNRVPDESLADKASFVSGGEGEQYSEVFWANAVTTTLYQIHPRVPSLTTLLECQYKFESGKIHVRTVKYKMTTRGGNWDRANIDVVLNAGEYERKNSPDTMRQDAQWHNYEVILSVPLGTYGVEVYLQMRIQYDGTDNDVEDWEGWSDKVIPAQPPLIKSPSSGQLVSMPFDVEGTGYLPRGVIYLLGVSGTYTVTLATASPTSNGGWTAPITLPSNITSFFARQHIGFEISVGSDVVTIRKSQTAITSPLANTLVNHSQLIFKGIRNTKAKISVQDARNNNETLTASDNFNTLTWVLPLKSGKYLPSGNFLVRAQNVSDGQYSYSNEVALTMLGFPAIGDSEFVQEATFDLEGDNGLPGAKVEVFEDLTRIPLGVSDVLANGNWLVKLKGLKPGPLSLVAEQTLVGLYSESIKAHAFRIRPPELETPKFEFPVAETVQFSGTGHYDSRLATRIRFIVKSYPDVTPPDTPSIVTVRNDGSWDVTATGWGLGKYTVQVVQEIADNDSGWIESQPREFTINNDMPPVTDVDYTKDYQPTFSGKGYNGATVSLKDSGANEIAPSVEVRNGQWSSRALEPWGPTNQRKVHITQSLGDHSSKPPCELLVSIPPLPPTVEKPPEEGLKPMFRGTCIEGATVSITFSGNNTFYSGIVVKGTWTFQRPVAFPADIAQTILVTQKFVEQPSDPQSRDFTVYPVMLKPVITHPAESDVGADVDIKGNDGVSGATMQLYEAQFQQKVGDPLLLGEDGEWEIRLTGLKFGPFTIYAKQERNGRSSEESERRSFNVMVPTPKITTPGADGKLTRTEILRGTGLPSARVEIWFEGADEPWLSDIPVSAGRLWQGTVTQPVGTYTIRARQLFTDGNVTHKSNFTESLTYDVTPAAPTIETPIEGEHVGRKVVVSGFGIPGDTVTAMLGIASNSALVQEDRTWSVAVEAQADGNLVLEVRAMLDGFESEPATSSVVAGVYLPIITEPAEGRWVHDPVVFAGTGEEGIGQVTSWFNTELKWTPLLTVEAKQWRGASGEVLRPGGNWCRFRQTLTLGTRLSDWANSARFEVMPIPGAISSRKDPTSG